jgi:GNAT superfamily N-acetyltransferase
MDLVRIEAEREFRMDLRKRLPNWPAPPGVRIAIASSAQIDELVKLRRRDTGEELAALYQDRCTRGQKCFVALSDDVVVACNWLCFGTEYDGALRFDLDADEVLCVDAFTTPARRGRSIHTALLHAMLAWAQLAGYRLAYTYVSMCNWRSAKTHARLDWQRYWMPHYLVLSSPLLCRKWGLSYEFVISLARSRHPLAPGFVFTRARRCRNPQDSSARRK